MEAALGQAGRQADSVLARIESPAYYLHSITWQLTRFPTNEKIIRHIQPKVSTSPA